MITTNVKRGRGRPAHPVHTRLRNVLHARFTDSEQTLITDAAAATGLTVSEFLRTLAVTAVKAGT